METQHQLPPPAQMMQMITGFWTSCCIYTAAKLDIADILFKKPLTTEQLAETTHCHAPSLYRVMRALTSVGIFNQNNKGEFELTTLGSTLQSDVPGSMKAMAIAQLGDHFNAWGNLLYSVKTGNIAFDHIEGMPVWKYYETHPDEGANFAKAMSGLTGAVVMNITPAYQFEAFDTIVDVGGGNGALLAAILKSTTHPKGIVFDEPYIEEQAKQNILNNGLNERCHYEKGSFFETIPEGADAYLMKFILHDWNETESLKILNNVHKAMKKDAKLLIIEGVVPEGNTPHPSKFMDLNMMAMTGGCERTEKEWKELLAKGNLKLSRIIPTHSPMFSIIEAEKA